jgi:hypothetical protein
MLDKPTSKVDRLKAKAATVIDAMRRGETLHLHQLGMDRSGGCRETAAASMTRWRNW